MAKTATPEPSEAAPESPGIMERLRGLISGKRPSVTGEINWQELAKLAERNRDDEAADWCLGRGYMPDPTYRLAKAAIVERPKLIAIYELGEKATRELPALNQQLAALRRANATSLEEAVRITTDQAAIEQQIQACTSAAAEQHAAGMWLQFLNQQFGELFQISPLAKMVNGSASPAMHEAFMEADCEPHVLHSWKMSISELQAANVAAQPRRRITT